MKISRVQEMRDADASAIANFGITQEILMENAGNAAYFTILQAMGIDSKKFIVFCGAGNNGGDGLVVARKLHSNGAQVSIFLMGDPKKYKGSALLNYQAAQKLNIPLQRLKSSAEAKKELLTADAVVDAIFGTGLTREAGGLYKEVIDLINESGKTVFSLDIPSGINGDNGQVMDVAVKADYTTTFGLPKLGNLLYPGFEFGGRLSVTHISFPPELHNSETLKLSVNKPLPLPIRKGDAHKGSMGKALFIAGAANYLGAPYFAAQSYLKAGGGLSFLAAPAEIVPHIASSGREIVFLPQKSTSGGSLALNNLEALLTTAAKTDFVVLGPGLSLNKGTRRLVTALCADLDRPLLIDGDGISAIAANPELIPGRTAPTVLTPHLAEMSRLCNQTVAEIEINKIDILQETAQKLNAIIVLKGAHSLIGIPDGRVYINLSGNPGMATAGSGDVLTGTIAAMFGLGLSFEDAVRTGVFMHGFAGDLAAAQIGQDGLVAGDILSSLPQALNKYRSEVNTIFKNNYGKIHLV